MLNEIIHRYRGASKALAILSAAIPEEFSPLKRETQAISVALRGRFEALTGMTDLDAKIQPWNVVFQDFGIMDRETLIAKCASKEIAEEIVELHNAQ